MIRHVIMVQFKPTATAEQIAILTNAWDDFQTRYGGVVALTHGPDLGMRPGNMSMTAVFDFVDAESWAVFDTDEHHQDIRRQIAAFVERAERCQFAI